MPLRSLFMLVAAVMLLFFSSSHAQAQAPAAPTGLTVSATSATNFQLSWTDNSNNESGFRLDINVNNGGWFPLFNYAPNTTSANITGGTPGVFYQFRLRAYTGTTILIFSGFSNDAGVTLPPAAVNAPTDLAFSLITKTSAQLAWTDTNTNEDGYAMEFRYGTTDPFVLLNEYGINFHIIDLNSIEPASFIQIRVRAFTNTSPRTYSPYSAIGSLTTKDGISSAAWHFGTSDKLLNPYQLVHSAANGQPASHNVTGLPPGLGYESATKRVVGTPTAAGTYKATATATWADGWTDSKTVVFRIFSAPTSTPMPQMVVQKGSSLNVDLNTYFADPDGQKAARVETSRGTMDLLLFANTTPLTVQNFLNYTHDGDWTGSCFHRSIKDFVVQGGGFKPLNTGLANFASVPTDPPVPNEPGLSNVPGAVAMAKLGGNPNSATSQWFVNMADNSANLDFQNGGFTVFGRIAGNGMAVADVIQRLPTNNYNVLVEGVSGNFQGWPMDQAVAPLTMDNTKCVMINSVAEIPALTYSTSAQAPGAKIATSLTGSTLHISGLQAGVGSAQVFALDLDGDQSSQIVQVVVTQSYAQWAADVPFAVGQSGAEQNPDNDALNNLQEFALMADPTIPDSLLLPAAGKTGGGPEYLTLTLPVRKFTQGLLYEVQATTYPDQSWTTIWSSTDGFSHAQVASSADQADRTVVTIKDTSAIGSVAKRFMRLRLTQQ